MNRILIHEDHSKADVILRDLRGFRPLLKEVQTKYNSLNVETLNEGLFQELIQYGVNPVSKRYRENLEKELDRTKVVNPQLRANLLTGTDEPIKALRDALRKLHEFKPWRAMVDSDPTLELDFIQMNEAGDFEVDREAILEAYCRIYLTEEETKYYQAIERLCESVNEVYAMAKEFGRVNNGFGFNENILNTISQFIRAKDERAIPNAQMLRHYLNQMKNPPKKWEPRDHPFRLKSEAEYDRIIDLI